MSGRRIRQGSIAVCTLLALFVSCCASHASGSSRELSVPHQSGDVEPRGLASASQFHGKMHSAEYYAWLYRWHRGGVFEYHESIHPCLLFNQSCSFSDAKDMNQRSVFHVNTTIVKQMEFVEVQYDLGDEDAREGDFVGVYCVDEEESPRKIVESGDFIDYREINATEEGSFQGSFVFGPLVNMRCSYQFRYLRHADKLQYHTLSESAHIEMERGHSEPVQVHLALTSTPGEMRVTWTSGKGAHQHVHYGLHSKNLTNHTEASTTTYGAKDMCSDPATIEAARWFRHPGYIHEGVMKGLLPGKLYYYNVGSKNGIVSREYSFTYPAAAGSSPTDSQDTQSFFVFGDLGQGVLEAIPSGEPVERHFTGLQYESRQSATSNRTVMKRIAQDLDEDVDGEYVAVVHVGDLSYAKGRTYVWDQFGALIEPVASKIPYMVAIGNHEYDYLSGGHGHDLSGSDVADHNGWHPAQGNFKNDSKGECGVPAVKRFSMPDNGNKLFWYSFRLGLTHHIVLSSEHNCSTHSPMHKWLVHELLHNVNRTETPWLLVHIHRPLYCSEKYASDYDVSLLLRGCMEHLFMKHHVDIVFSGHYHAYERTCPVYKSHCHQDATSHQANAPIHIMIGSGGAELDDIDYYREKDNAAEWSVNRLQEYGYGRFHVHNASHAHFEFVRSRDRQVADDAWIVSRHNWNTSTVAQASVGV